MNSKFKIGTILKRNEVSYADMFHPAPDHGKWGPFMHGDIVVIVNATEHWITVVAANGIAVGLFRDTIDQYFEEV